MVKISDDLPDEAGGDGTDYLLNIEEVSFEGDHVSLVIDSWGYPEERQMQFDFNWKPAGGATKVKVAVKTIESGWCLRWWR